MTQVIEAITIIIPPSKSAMAEAPNPSYNLPTLPQDIVLSILSRLPVKALCKFKCVSKLWLNLIVDPFFITAHRSRSRNPNLLLLRKCPPNGSDIIKWTIELSSRNMNGNAHCDFFTLCFEKPVETLPYCGDIICFAGELGFYLCNPSSHEFAKLPEASHCTSAEVNAGFGYVKSSNEYILVHLFDRSLVYYNDIGCEILRFSDGELRKCNWRVVEGSCCPYVVSGWGVLVENGFHWMIWDEYDQWRYEAIVFFDLEKEVFGTISPPQECLDPGGVCFLMEFRGLLCLVDPVTRPLTMDIWMMKDYKSRLWVREYSIDLTVFDLDMTRFIIPLDDREILMQAKQESLVCYNVESKSIRRIDNLIEGKWTWLRHFKDSFFSLDTT